MSKPAPTLKLYWATTPDHDEDWFIFATTKRAAANFHADAEGYDREDATAELVIRNVQLTKFVDGPPPCWAQLPELIALGFEIIDANQTGRSVRLGDRIFIEGHLDYLIARREDDLAESVGKGRPRGTARANSN